MLDIAIMRQRLTDGYIDYDTTVQFPFGYGLSYTNFDWEVEKTELGDIGGTINIDVKLPIPAMLQEKMS